MAKVIETTKGVFLVVEKEELKFQEKRGILHVYHHKCLVDFFNAINLYRVTEEEALMIGEFDIPISQNDLKRSNVNRLYSFLYVHNIEITPNTYIIRL